ncbi:hypothetical protein ABIB75_007269 [Bradyrhizobium sp. GM2.2]
MAKAARPTQGSPRACASANTIPKPSSRDGMNEAAETRRPRNSTRAATAIEDKTP